MKIGPKYKICRRVGDPIFSKCQTTKFAIAGKDQKQKGKRRRQVSEYGSQLIEKQKARYTYGVSEKQFSNYIKKAQTQSGLDSTAEIFKLLETRLDNMVFRLGLTISRAAARQMVSHGHITVNDKKLNIPSYQVKLGDKIGVRAGSKDKALFSNLNDRLSNYTAPAWVIFDDQKLTGGLKAWPTQGQEESNLNFRTIIEFYSRV